jgi:hypothetical protein
MNMAKTLWRYNVTDTVTKEQIVENGTIDDVCTTIGVDKFNLSKYAVNGYLYNRRYAISRVAWEAPQDEEDNTPLNSAFTPELVEEWNNVMMLFHPKKAVIERETV